MSHRLVSPRRIATLSWSILLIPLLSACTGETPEPAHTAIVVGSHQGGPQLISESGTAIEWLHQELEPSASRPGSLTVIVNQGSPISTGTAQFDIDTSASWNTEASVKRNTKAAVELVAEAQPTVPQASPVRSLVMASDAVRGKSNATVIVVDNGLSTSSVDGLFWQSGTVITEDWDTEQTIASLGPLPSFDGIHVRWLGLCQVTAPQEDCPLWARAKLTDFYTHLVTSNGGTISFEDAPIPSAGVPEGLPVVDAVPFAGAAPKATTVSLGNDQIRFQENTANYHDDEAAEALLTTLAGEIMAGPYSEVDVRGCVNNDGSPVEALVRLGEARADRVASDLAKVAVDLPLRSWSLGADCPGYVPGGEEANMRVIITAK